MTCHNVMPMCRVSRSVMSGSQTIFKPITNNSALLQTIFGGNTAGTAASFKGEIVSIMPLKLYPGVVENLWPQRHRARNTNVMWTLGWLYNQILSELYSFRDVPDILFYCPHLILN